LQQAAEPESEVNEDAIIKKINWSILPTFFCIGECPLTMLALSFASADAATPMSQRCSPTLIAAT
jgi:hypothetical protein